MNWNLNDKVDINTFTLSAYGPGEVKFEFDSSIDRMKYLTDIYFESSQRHEQYPDMKVKDYANEKAPLIKKYNRMTEEGYNFIVY